jgi:hypothetical protein
MLRQKCHTTPKLSLMWSLIKATARQIVSSRILGAIDYVRSPSRGEGWAGGPFSGQRARQALFREMVAKLSPRAIVETGTHLGTTTKFMAQTGLPVYTIETDPRSYGFVRARFWRTPNITLLYGDSRAGLRELLDGSLREMARHTLLFYLDAHWNADLPLAEELEIVFSRCPEAIVMIDDFEVPFDRGYGYDDYGPRKALTASYIQPIVSRYQLQTFYPTTRSVDESGLRRGCVVLANENTHGKAIASIPLLGLVGETEPASSDLED